MGTVGASGDGLATERGGAHLEVDASEIEVTTCGGRIEWLYIDDVTLLR